MKKNQEPKPIITDIEAESALQLLNSPANRADIEKNNTVRLNARNVLSEWTLQAADEQEKDRRKEIIKVALGVGEKSPFMPPIDTVLPGAINDTGIISVSSTGTGLPRQEKPPRDLRTSE